MSAAASRTCSQLSNTNSRDRPSRGRSHAVGDTQPRLLGDAEDSRDRLGDRRGVADSGQFDHEHPIGEVACQSGGELQREPGLAHPADTGQRDQTVCFESRLQLNEFHLASNETGGRRSRLPGVESSVFSGGNSVRRPVGSDLEELDRLGDVP